MDKKDFNKLNNKVDLIEKINDIANYQMYVLIAEYVDSLLKLDPTGSFLEYINLESDTLESKNLLDSYNKISLVHEIITSPDEIDYHGRNHPDSMDYYFYFSNIKNLRDAGGRASDLVKLNLKKQDYKFHLLKFHKALSDYLGFDKKDLTHESAAPKGKIIYITIEDGIFMNRETATPSYPIGRKSKRAKLVWKLRGGVVSGPDLKKYLDIKKLPNVKESIDEINKLFKSHLSLENDLIVHVATGGYMFNDEFNVQFL